MKAQSPGDGDALLLAAGQLVGIGLELVAEAHPLQDLHRSHLDLGAGTAADLDRRYGDVAENVHVLKQIILLEHDRHAIAGAAEAGLVGIVDGLAIENDLAVRGQGQADQDTEQRRLAGTGGTDDRHHLAAADRQRDVRQDLRSTVFRAQIFDVEVRQGGAPARRQSG